MGVGCTRAFSGLIVRMLGCSRLFKTFLVASKAQQLFSVIMKVFNVNIFEMETISFCLIFSSGFKKNKVVIFFLSTTLFSE